MTISDFNNALCYIDSELVDEFIIHKEKMYKKIWRVQLFLKYAPIAACICIVCAAALLLPKLANEPNTPDNQLGVGVTSNTTASQLENESEETTNITNPPSILEGGFNYPSLDALPSNIFCGYRSEHSEFDINNVTLNFYYGCVFLTDLEYELTMKSYPNFEIAFQHENGEKFTVKKVDENLISEKYSCEAVWDENWYIVDMIFNHSESLTIPKELFINETGIIYLQIYGINQALDKNVIECIVSTPIAYEKTGDKIVLKEVPSFCNTLINQEIYYEN